LIKSLNPNDHVGIVIFENGATTASYLTPFKDRALLKLQAIKQKEGKTAIGDGLAWQLTWQLLFQTRRSGNIT